MATKQPKSTVYKDTAKKKRPGIHAKCKTSNLKNSKYYVKAYKGQGR